MPRFALVNSRGKVENVIVLDDDSDWQPPQGLTLIETDGDVEIGWIYQSGAFVPVPIIEGSNP